MSDRCRSHGRALGTRARTQRGAVAVEFALVVPLLVALLLGVVTGGLAYTHSIGLTNAVREGARFGGTTLNDTGTWSTAVIQRTRDTQFDDLNSPKATTICARLLKNALTVPAVPTTNVAGSCDGPATLTGAPAAPIVEGGKCVAMVWAVRPFKINAFFVNGGGDIQRGSVARYERTC